MLDYILVNVKYYFTLNLVKLLISKGNMEKAITEILENKVEEDFSQDFESVSFNSDIAPRIIDNGYSQNMSQKALGVMGGSYSASHEETVNGLSIQDLRNSSHFNWTVSKAPVNDSYEGRQRRVKGIHTVVRNDTKRQLGTIRGASSLLQNKDLFDLVEPIIDSGQYSLEKAQSNDGGRSVQLLLRSNTLGQFDLLPNDPAQAYLAAKVTRSGKPKISITHLIERLICSNGMMGFNAENVVIDQTRGADLILKQLQRNILNAEKYLPQLIESYQRMSEFDMSNPYDRDEYFRRANGFAWNNPELEFLTSEEELAHDKEMKKHKRTLDKIEQCWEREVELAPAGTENSLATAYQGVTRYVRHERSRNQNAKQKALYFGAGQRINDKAFKVAKEIMDADLVLA